MLLISLFALTFFALSMVDISYALFLLFVLLPTYVIRFSLFGVPSTILEIMVFCIIFATLHLYKYNSKHIYKELSFLLKQSHNTLLIGTGLMLLGATINVFFGVNKIESIGILKGFYVEPVLLFFTLILLQKKVSITKPIIAGLLTGGLITIIFGIIQKYTGYMVPYDFWENRDTYRITGWWGFPNGVGIYLAPITAIVIGLFLKQKKIWQAIFVLLGILTIFFAKTTGAIIALVGVVGLYLLIYKKTRIPAIIVGIALFAILLLTPNTNSIKKELLLQDYSGQLRIQMWGETVEYLKAHPIIGTGLRSYQARIYPYRYDKKIEVFHHPHNMFLTAWSETGIVGLVGLLFIIIWLVQNACINTDKNKQIIYIALFTFLIMGLVDSPYIKNDTAILFWGLIALIIIKNKDNSLI